MKIAIHQPNFFPWLGYFEKINKSEKFVFMDDVAVPKSGKGSWLNRVKLIIDGKPSWVTCPYIHEHGEQIIRDVKIDYSQGWQKKIERTIDSYYRKAPFYEEVIEVILNGIYRKIEFLSEYNIQNIKYICSKIGITKEFIFQSNLENINSSSTQQLIDIVKNVGGDTYICGGGASGYQEDELFKKSGVDLEYQNFVHPEFNQIGSNQFIAGMSIIDVLFNNGFEETNKIIIGKSNFLYGE